MRAPAELLKLSQTQQRMVAHEAPHLTEYSLALLYRPAYVATGDYHDFFSCRNGLTAVFVADGSGHGPCASVLAATVRAILHTHPDLHHQPGETLTDLNRMLHALLPTDLFMTAVYVQLGKNGLVRWASAGHDPPLRTGKFSIDRQHIGRQPIGQPLSVNAHEVYTNVDWQLLPLERILLFTDGLVEARHRNGIPFGRRRLLETFAALKQAPIKEVPTAIVSRVVSHQGFQRFEDDLTVIAIERSRLSTSASSRNEQPPGSAMPRLPARKDNK